MRNLFIHVGLHKTGTSSIQWFFSEHRQRMRALGLLYPLAGIVPAYPGHHNLAWELAGDRRFDSRLGTWRSLFAEMQLFDGDVLISSEDFEGSLGFPSRWAAICTHAKRCGFKIYLVIFLREQAAYLQSLFLQNLVLGCGELFSEDLEDCLRYGQLRKRDWRFHFDYHDALSKLRRSGFDEFIVKGYAGNKSFDAIECMCKILHLSPQALIGFDKLHKNVRRPLHYYLGRFYVNRFQTHPINPQILDEVSQGVGTLRLAPRVLAQLQQRFLLGNRALLQEHGVLHLTDAAEKGDGATTSTADMARVFSFESSLRLRQWLGQGVVIGSSDHRGWLDWIGGSDTSLRVPTENGVG